MSEEIPKYKTIEKKAGDFSIIYNPDIDKYREIDPHLIRKICESLDQFEGENKFKEPVQGVQVELLQNKNYRKYFKISIGEDSFFVKRDDAIRGQGGTKELEISNQVRDRLKDIEGVEVLEHLFALTNRTHSFIVSRYDKNLEKNLYNVLRDIQDLLLEDDSSDDPEINSLKLKERSIRQRLCNIETNIGADIYDVDSSNMAYDPNRDVIIVYDLNVKKNGLVESPDDDL